MMNGADICKYCRGPLAVIGVLGQLVWFRCIDCGAEQDRKKRKGEEARRVRVV